MKYNSKYDRWVTKGGLVYRYNKKRDRLVQCKLTLVNGYQVIMVSKPNRTHIAVHRLVYETFVDEIQNGYEIDHINTIRDDNRLDNLRVVTHAENNRNPLTRKHKSDACIKKSTSDFGKKYFEHFGYSKYKNITQYWKEQAWYHYHNNKCRWEDNHA